MYASCHGSVKVAFIAHWSQGLLQSQQKQYLTEQGLGFYRKYTFRLQKAEKLPLEYRNYKCTIILTRKKFHFTTHIIFFLFFFFYMKCLKYCLSVEKSFLGRR